MIDSESTVALCGLSQAIDKEFSAAFNELFWSSDTWPAAAAAGRLFLGANIWSAVTSTGGLS